MLVKFGFPSADQLRIPSLSTEVPDSPFQNEFLTKIFDLSMHVTTPLTIAIVYFSTVHFLNPILRSRQISKYLKKNPQEKAENLTEKQLKRLPSAPYYIATTSLFKLFVILHNLFLCVYSLWTFLGMTKTIATTMNVLAGDIFPAIAQIDSFKKVDLFFQTICSPNEGVFSKFITNKGLHNLEFLGWWFYMSKFYEVLDTIIILLKGRPSSLLQSYHHAGAMMCMWAGVRFQSPPIWIFVVFNSFIHTLMYFYYTLSCLHIRVPMIFKRVLTSLQITQFVVGGSLGVVHLFISIIDTTSTDQLRWVNCIATADQTMPLLLNVAYLTPLTALFAAFYIESYLKRK
ncbi:uncharacterized protein SPAPADRAFT_62191 [Spathaspora passalidarum NRRL Y-27907]|uniref:Elongation of fatty acids protein n=1 Tax=Spathaspora passalidarum (strain NRRL Y-27907 / 11-Y1) TaxID=619300 RepID=G3AQM8_SPAPN|nr:uncharacterized protein SPAPADRAFT_62191 [Spathaspora passalidarum NRRL Y-27907]EGW31575.1 hypothetical protein SPAPADRAFT_62191 [Spathaspora passalidarum NRRL Y-27907]